MTKFAVQPQRECELDPPVRSWLESQGFQVQAEVRGVDLLAVRGALAVAVELKTTPGLHLVAQGLDRQKVTPVVYVAFPRPGNLRKARGWKDMKAICIRLGLGILLVSKTGSKELVQEALSPDPSRVPATRSKRAIEALREWRGRKTNLNLGGSTRVPLLTAYRESVLQIARRLHQGAVDLATLRQEGFSVRVEDVLRRDYYGWFHRRSRGVYELSASGRSALETKYAWVLEEKQ